LSGATRCSPESQGRGPEVRGFEMIDRAIPRQGYELHADGRRVAV